MGTEEFDPVAFGRHALSRWKIVAGAAAVAVGLSAAASLILPKRYTATASLIIDLPAGADPRAAAALSPVYLESLKTYERFASSDTLFREAITQLGIRLRSPGRTFEALKSSVLRISRPASTRVLDISATLANPAEAQKLAQYLAERTVELNRSLEARSANDLERQAESVADAAAERLDEVNRARAGYSRGHPVDALAGEIQNMTELRFDLQRNLEDTRAGLEDLLARGEDSRQISGMRARIAALEKQDQELRAEIARDSGRLEDFRARRDELDAEQQAARAEATAARNHWNEARVSLAYQGERVSVLDPGTVPEQPSFPNLPLNIAVALALSLAGSIFWVALSYGHGRLRDKTVIETERSPNVFSLTER